MTPLRHLPSRTLSDRLRARRAEAVRTLPHRFGVWLDGEYDHDAPDFERADLDAFAWAWGNLGKRSRAVEYVELHGARLSAGRWQDYCVEVMP